MIQVPQLIRTSHRVGWQSAAIGVGNLIANQVPDIQPQLLTRQKHLFHSVLAFPAIVEERGLSGGGFGTSVPGCDERVVSAIYVPHPTRPQSAERSENGVCRP